MKDSEREYGLDDKVGVDLNGSPMMVRKWAEEWWKWMLGMNEGENPFVLTSPHLNTVKRTMGHQPNQIQKNSIDNSGESVWFLVAPPYGVEGFVRTIVPIGWSVLASPYNYVSSAELMPNTDLMELGERDLAGVYEMYSTLDGETLTGCTVKSEGESFEANLPVNNVFGAEPGTHHLVQHGHWVFLRPLSVGDHFLHLHGYSKNYQLDIRYHLLVQKK